MTHVVEVAQSIKIEDTQKDTILAFADGIAYSVRIPAAVKRDCFHILTMRYRKVRLAYLKVFSAALFLLLRQHITQIHFVIIDIEYMGHDGDMRGMLLNYIRRIVPDFPKDAILFKAIGHSAAHYKAYDTHVGKMQPDYVVTTKELLELVIH